VKITNDKSGRSTKVDRQVVGNIGLYYVCYRLSRLGWNVMPTARNARGLDVLLYDQAVEKTTTVQVKALSKRDPVPPGTSLESLLAEHIVVCVRCSTDEPQCFILSSEDVRKLAVREEPETPLL
jgi:hypothetical protein